MTLFPICFIFQPEPVGLFLSFRIYGISSLFGPRAKIIAFAGCAYCGSNAFILQNFCLVFRYAAVNSQRLNDLFAKNTAKIILIVFSQIFTMGIFIFVYRIFVPPEQFYDPTFEMEKMAVLRSYIGENEFVLLPVSISSSSRLPMLLTLFFFLVSEIFSVYMIYAILKTLRIQAAQYSKNTYRLHYQLTYLLCVQFAFPFLLIVLPLSFKWVTVLMTGMIKNEFNL